MPDEPWTWGSLAHPNVIAVVATSAIDLRWSDRLESAASNAVVGKVLCVCAASAVAREVVATLGEARPALEALELLDHWIDDPTDERFDQICSLIFDEGFPEFDPDGVVWWALRTATSSVGNFEAAWALDGACNAAARAGFTAEQLRAVVERDLLSRSRPRSLATVSLVGSQPRTPRS